MGWGRSVHALDTKSGSRNHPDPATILSEQFAMTIIPRARFPADAPAVLDIWREFVASPSVSLEHQNNHIEFDNIPGKYAEPDGRILLADRDGEVDGCVSLKRVDHEICEMKRLYVRPCARGTRLGFNLIARLITEAESIGYSEMRLDVLEEFIQAKKLYAAFGFVSAEPISFNPLPGTQFLGLRLK
jgi:putative acetyltransferase